MRRNVPMLEPGLYELMTRSGYRKVASIPTRQGAAFRVYLLGRAEEVREVLEELGADADAFLGEIPDEDYYTEDELFFTPGGMAGLGARDPDRLHELLYREPSGGDPGGWLRRPLNADARARGLTRAKSWLDVAG